MSKYSFRTYKPDIKIYFVVLTTVLLMAAFVDVLNPHYFARYLGNVNPILTIFIAGIIGFAVLRILRQKWGFIIFNLKNFKIDLRHIGLICLFAAVSIVVDYFMIFPIEMNVPFPDSLCFYPAIAFFVEIVFHVLPMAIFLFLLRVVFPKVNNEKLIFAVILLVSLIEPTFQILMDDYPVWALIIIWVNLYFFNLTQLIAYKHYGFVTMYLYRLVYYLIWHIIWGHFRLDLFF